MQQSKRIYLSIAFLLLCVSGFASTAAQTVGGNINYAAVVVQGESGAVETRCVGFDEESISGYELLERAGFYVQAEGSAGMGALVCAIDGEGCDYPNEPCACRCQGGECIYWAYSQLVNNDWRYSPLGASSRRIRNGDVDGWAWGGGSTTNGSTPPVVEWETACGALAAPIAQEPTTVLTTEISATKVVPTASPASSAIVGGQIPASSTQSTTTTTPVWGMYLLFGLIIVGLLVAGFIQRKRLQ